MFVHRKFSAFALRFQWGSDREYMSRLVQDTQPSSFPVSSARPFLLQQSGPVHFVVFVEIGKD